jgi:SAM-dependent methyltransferase
VSTSSLCAACGARELSAHLNVSGELGAAGLIPTTDQFGSALGDIVRCGRCGHMQLEPMPAEAMLADAYAEAASEDYVGEERGQRETARRALARIERHRRGDARAPRLLDLGCWVGFLMAEARERGWDPLGVEPSEFAAAYARDRLGLEVINAGLFDAQLPAGSFGAVTLGDVIEHFTDPAQALGRIRELLADDGLLWMALPDAGSRLARVLGRRWWSVIPTHVQYFTRGSVATLLARSGFTPLEITTAPKAFTVGYYLERIGGYSPAVSRALAAGAARAGVDGRLWAPDFRDRMAVIARRV